MDQQEYPRRPNRHVSRSQRNNQRRNMVVQRRNLVHYRVHNVAGNVAITNNFYFDVNGLPTNPNPGAQFPAVLPSSLPLPLTVHGPNQSNAANLQITYVPPPVPYVPTQATHIAIPLTHSPAPASQFAHASHSHILNGGAVRFVNVTPSPPSRNMHVPEPRMMNAMAPGAVNSMARPPGNMRFPAPRQASVHQPQNTSTTAYLVTQVGNFVTRPPTANTSAPMYVAIPSTTTFGAVTYAHSSTTPLPTTSQMPTVQNIPHIPPVDEVNTLTITEILSSNPDEELN